MTSKEKFDATREFSRRVIQASWEGLDVGSDDIQEWAQELGLIFVRKATKQDEQDYAEIVAGENMYELESWMRTPTPRDGLGI
jgi:hypothetical protein